MILVMISRAPTSHNAPHQDQQAGCLKPHQPGGVLGAATAAAAAGAGVEEIAYNSRPGAVDRMAPWPSSNATESPEAACDRAKGRGGRSGERARTRARAVWRQGMGQVRPGVRSEGIACSERRWRRNSRSGATPSATPVSGCREIHVPDRGRLLLAVSELPMETRAAVASRTTV